MNKGNLEYVPSYLYSFGSNRGHDISNSIMKGNGLVQARVNGVQFTSVVLRKSAYKPQTLIARWTRVLQEVSNWVTTFVSGGTIFKVLSSLLHCVAFTNVLHCRYFISYQ